jgi:hypothetical protein
MDLSGLGNLSRIGRIIKSIYFNIFQCLIIASTGHLPVFGLISVGFTKDQPITDIVEVSLPIVVRSLRVSLKGYIIALPCLFPLAS